MKNINIKYEILIQIDNKNISWDLICSNVFINESGWKRIFKYFLSLPIEVYKIPKNSDGFTLLSTGATYSFIRINKIYLKENWENMVNNLKIILENKENLTEYKSWEEKQKLDIYKIFENERKLLCSKYDYWLKKYKENKGYNRFKILERDGFKCKLCGRSPPDVQLHIDHWVPKSKGGLDIYENLVTLCQHCNISKSAQIPKNNIEEILEK